MESPSSSGSGRLGELRAALDLLSTANMDGDIRPESRPFGKRGSDAVLIWGALLGDGSPRVTRTGRGQAVGLRGVGGISKTVLAAALAHDFAVRAVFPDGIFWLTISQTPDLLSRQHQLAQALTGQPQVLRDFLEW